MKITKKAFADILEKRLVDRIIFAHLEPSFPEDKRTEDYITGRFG